MQRIDQRAWPCVDKDNGCDGLLGHVVNGELSINLTSVSIVNSDGVNIVITCKKCGKPKTWFAKDSAITNSFFKMALDGIASSLARIQRRRENAESN